jgi:hypothetical protein
VIGHQTYPQNRRAAWKILPDSEATHNAGYGRPALRELDSCRGQLKKSEARDASWGPNGLGPQLVTTDPRRSSRYVPHTTSPDEAQLDVR